MPDHDAHDIIVLFSARSRDAYAAEATARGETYTFTDAWGLPRTWIKGEYAYLAPNAAGLLLARCNLKHHLVEEAGLDAARLARCRALLVPNAGHLAPETVARIEAWLADGNRRLIVTGKTNLPPSLLGLHSCEPAPVQGYTGWRWRAGSPFAGDAWETLNVSGYKGHPAHRIVPAKGSRVLADLVELSGDLSDATTATVSELGPAIVLTDRTVYVTNQVLELIGGMLQAHLNVEAVRYWANATHWGDTLLFLLRGLLREVGLASLWRTRLRSFGTYDGVLSFRHDVHGMRDYTFLDYQIQNLIPASYDIEDPTFSTNIDEAMARDWVERTTQHSFIEPALHNDSSIGDPPTAIFGKGLFEHVSKAAKSLGITICTCGRHAGGHMHPETIDAMDYLYAQDKTILGLCTFCYYHMVEYGVRDPNVMVGGTIGEKPLTYVTDVRRTIATSGIWFPFRPVVTTTAEWRKLRGWDRTHEYDAAYELVETIFAGHSARRPGVDDRLENGVYSFQYHPELARDPSVNNGKGTLDYVRYCINGSVWLGEEELIHVADGAFITVPPIDPGASLTLRFKPETVEAVLVRQPSNKGLVVLDARHDPRSGEARITVSVCRQQPLSIEGVDPEGVYRVQIDNQPALDVAVRTVRTIQALLSEKTDAARGRSRRAVTPGTTRFLDLVVEGEENRFVERTLRIRQLPADEARPIRQALIAAIPAKRGRVT